MKKLIVAIALLISNFAIAEPVPVLMYHRVVSEFTADTPPGITVISVNQFKEQLNWLSLEGYNAITISELAELMRGSEPIPAKTIVLTFDDGWIDQLNTLPVMKQHGYRGVYAIIARIPDAKYSAYMTWDQIRLVAKDHEIASHMYSHSHLATEELEHPGSAEIIASKSIIEQQVNRPITTIVWPYGEYTQTFVDVAKSAGFDAAVTVDQTWCTVPNPPEVSWDKCITTMTKNNVGQDPLYIRRVNVDGRCDLAFFINSVQVGYGDPASCVKKD